MRTAYTSTPRQAEGPVVVDLDFGGALIRRAAPRLVRDAVGPLAVFFIGWKLIGLTAGIAMAALFGLSVLVYERRQGRPAVLVRLALVLVAIRACVGLSSGSATVYLAQEIGIDTLLGCAVFISLTRTRPFAWWFAEEVVPLSYETRESGAFGSAMRTVTIVWGAYFLARALVRLTAVLTLSTDGYALVLVLTDAPFLIALLAWSIYYAVGAIRPDNPRQNPAIAATVAAPSSSD